MNAKVTVNIHLKGGGEAVVEILPYLTVVHFFLKNLKLNKE